MPNPLAVAFGAALRAARGKRSTQTIADQIGIADSFYRLIESGRNHASISKGPAIWGAFKGELHYEAILMFLGSIAASEDRKSASDTSDTRGKHLHANASLMAGALADTHPFKSFLRHFLAPPRNVPSSVVPCDAAGRSILELVDVKKVDIREVIDVTGLSDEALDVLRRFDQYDPAARLAENIYARDFFDSVPSNYKPMFDGLRESVMRLPHTFLPQASWEWEELNESGFRELTAVCYAGPLVSEQNLQNYQFDYLWGEEFQAAMFHILDGGDADALKKAFWDNLKRALPQTEQSARRIAAIDSVMAKTVFRPCSETGRDALLALLRDLASNTASNPPNAMWFFRTSDQALVGAASFVNDATKRSEWIRFLTFKECSSVLPRVNSVMEAE